MMRATRGIFEAELLAPTDLRADLTQNASLWNSNRAIIISSRLTGLASTVHLGGDFSHRIPSSTVRLSWCACGDSLSIAQRIQRTSNSFDNRLGLLALSLYFTSDGELWKSLLATFRSQGSRERSIGTWHT